MDTTTHPSTSPRTDRGHLWRARWAAVGAALCVSVGAGGAVQFAAGAEPDDLSGFVSITPARILDTRDPVDVGLAGPFVSAVSQDLDVTGTVSTTAGQAVVVPDGATGVVLNVTVLNATADGFLSVRPADAPGPITTSNLNVRRGDTLPNAVTVALPTTGGADDGRIELTFDAYGIGGPTADVLVDVVGYTMPITGHHERTFIGHSPLEIQPLVNSSINMTRYTNGITLAGTGDAQLALEGPAIVGDVEYHLESVEFCVSQVAAPGRVDRATIHGFDSTSGILVAERLADVTSPGCYRIDAPGPTTAHAYGLTLTLAGAAGSLTLTSVTTSWIPEGGVTPPQN